MSQPKQPLEHCKERVVWDRTWGRTKQCSRYARKDGYCKQHHPDSVRERDAKSEADWRAKMDARRKPFDTIKELRAENERLTAIEENLKDVLRRMEDGPCSHWQSKPMMFWQQILTRVLG